MFMTIGIGMLMIWTMNIGYIIMMILSASPKWWENNVTAEDMVTNLMTNSSEETLKLMGIIQKMSGPLFLGGVTIVLLSFII